MKKKTASKSKLKMNLSPCSPEGITYDDVAQVHAALRPYLGYCLHKVTTILKAKVNEAFLKQGVQGHHFAILSVIASSAEVNQMKICEEMGIDKASMVKITDHLEKLKYIERVGSIADRRVKNLHITKAGQKFLDLAKSQRKKLEDDFLDCLEPSEREHFKKTLLTILDAKKSGQKK